MTMAGKHHTPETKRLMSNAKIGSLNPHWEGDAVSADGGRQRAIRHFPLPLACQECGKIARLERHHKDANTANNAEGNIAFLCRHCHKLSHGLLKRFTTGLRMACFNGHAWSDANTYTSPNGQRACRICNAVAARKYKERHTND